MPTGESVRGWELGERAGVGWLGFLPMGRAIGCRADRENLCPDARFTGLDRDGGYAQLVTVRADFALRLPGAFDDLHAAPLFCGGVIGFRALRPSGVAKGRRLGLFGFVASCALDAPGRPLPGHGRIGRDALGRGADAGVGGSARTGSAAMTTRCRLPSMARSRSHRSARWWSRRCERSDRAAPSRSTRSISTASRLSIYDLLWRQRILRSVANYTRQDAREILDLAARIPIVARVEEVRLQDANGVLARVRNGEVTGTPVLVPPDR